MNTKNKDSDDESEGEDGSANNEDSKGATAYRTVDASTSSVMTSTISAPFDDKSETAQNSATNFGALSSFDNNLDLLGLMGDLNAMPKTNIDGAMFDRWGNLNVSGQTDRHPTWQNGAFSWFSSLKLSDIKDQETSTHQVMYQGQ